MALKLRPLLQPGPTRWETPRALPPHLLQPTKPWAWQCLPRHHLQPLRHQRSFPARSVLRPSLAELRWRATNGPTLGLVPSSALTVLSVPASGLRSG